MNDEILLKKGRFDGDMGAAEQPSANSIEGISAEAILLAEREAELASVSAELVATQTQLDDQRDSALRAQAELQNQIRRLEKQVQDAHKFAAQRFAESILPVMDSLEMGIQSDGDINSIREGMRLTMNQFESVFSKFNIEALDPLNQPFNPEQHQAVSVQNSPEHDNNTVIAVMQKGYSLSGRVIRPAMVMICKK